MSNLENYGTWIVGGIGSMYAFATGNFGTATLVLVGIILLDVVSGVMKGLKTHRLKSAIMSVGLMKKGGIILSIVFATMLDTLLNTGQPVFAPMMTWLAIGNEGLSVVENLSALGVKFPDQITKRLGQIKGNYEIAQIEKDLPKADEPEDEQ